MPTSNIRPLLGKHTSVFTVQGATKNESTGVWTLNGSAQSILTYNDGFEVVTETETERVEGYVTTVRNPVGLVTGSMGTLAEIMRRAAPYSYLEQIYYSNTHIAVTETQGAARIFYCLITSCRRATARGKNLMVMTMETEDIGAANPDVTFT